MSADQELVRQTTRRFLVRESPIERVRSLADPGVEPDWQVWQQGVELGWTSILRSDGVDETSRLEYLVGICHELGRLLQPWPVIPANVVVSALLVGDSEADHGDTLAKICSGEVLPTWAFDDSTLTLYARGERDGWIINGVARLVPFADVAHFVLITAATLRGAMQFLVPLPSAGVSLQPLSGIDFTKRFFDVEFDDVHVLPTTVVERSGHVQEEVSKQRDLARLLLCAESVGASERVLEITTQYAKERFAFGRPIGSFQAVKHLCAGMLMRVEASRAATAAAAASFHRGQTRAINTSIAKAYVSESSSRIARDAIQVHGGIGFTWEHDCHLYLRRAKANEFLLGSPSVHRDRLSSVVMNLNADEARAVSTAQVGGGADVSEEAAFRMRARDWLVAAQLPERRPGTAAVVGATASPIAEAERVASARRFQRSLYDAGFAGIGWPAEYGGSDRARGFREIFDELASRYDLPNTPFEATLGILLPTILTWGSEAQKRRYIAPALRGDELWAQFLSEPSAGSDLAGLRTRATRTNDGWLLNGQKVWSSGALHADFALCLARTDDKVPKHQGLTMFIIDIKKSTRITIRPIKMLTGGSEFCEEFLDDVSVGEDDVLGEVNRGWEVVRTLLSFERGGGRGPTAGPSTFDRAGSAAPVDLVRLAQQRSASEDPNVRQRIGEAYIGSMIGAQLAAHITRSVESGALPPAAGSLFKLFQALWNERRAEISLEVAGSRSVFWPSNDSGADQWSQTFLSSRALSIAGGTNEIQATIVGERLLGLPRDVDPDRDVPFSEVRHG